MRLAAMPHVIGVSCQTNLSFSVSRFLDEAEAEQADVSKFMVLGELSTRRWLG